VAVEDADYDDIRERGHHQLGNSPARDTVSSIAREELKAEIVELDQQLATDDSAVVAELRQKLAAIRAMAERDSG
jgi:hypothetical protein